MVCVVFGGGEGGRHAVAKMSAHGGLVDAHDAGIVADMPPGEIRPLTLVDKALRVRAGGQERLRNVEDFIYVGSEPETGVNVADADIVARREKGKGAAESPAGVERARAVVVLMAAAEFPADVVGEGFDDCGVGVGAVKVAEEEGLVEGEDAFDFDAEGNLEVGGHDGRGEGECRCICVYIYIQRETLPEEVREMGSGRRIY